MATVAIPAATEQISYADLYTRWEKGNWRANEIDFGQDRIDWHERMTPAQRRGALWLYTLFFHGEDTVADTLGPYLDAVPLEEQKYFIATQQVDEARHAVFFKRFMHEVVGLGDGTIAGTLAATMPEITWGHRKVFGHLEEMAGRLRAAPRDRHLLAKAVTLYHVMIEGGLAQSGQHTIEESLTELDLLPGFREGMRNVALDEQRHIAFGVRLLADLFREDPEGIQEAIMDEFRLVLPWSTCVAEVPGWDLELTRSLGYELEDIYEHGAHMSRRGCGRSGCRSTRSRASRSRSTSRRASAGRAASSSCGPATSARSTTSPGSTRRRPRSSSTRPPARPTPRRCRPARRSSGRSPTPSRGTSSSTATPPAPSAARRRSPPCGSR
jgi:ribonucleotide reductase beta subunit family protein with ferritin-like domain